MPPTGRVCSVVAKGPRAPSYSLGELNDVSLLTRALREADGAFLLLPPANDAPDVQDRLAHVEADAVAESGVSHVVLLLSSSTTLEQALDPYLRSSRACLASDAHVDGPSLASLALWVPFSTATHGVISVSVPGTASEEDGKGKKGGRARLIVALAGHRTSLPIGGGTMSAIDRNGLEGGNGRLPEREERMKTAQLAHHLSSVALRQWERALTGVVALPAAAALGTAAVAMYGAALIERAFEVFESAIGEIGRTISQDDGHHRDRMAERSEARA